MPTLVFGALIDFYVEILSFMTPHTYISELIVVVLATILLAIGVCFEVNSHTLMMAGEGIVAAFAYRSKKKFSILKIYNDILMISLAALLSLIFFHQLVGVREGTLITAIFTGRFIAVLEASHSRLIQWIHQ